MYRRAPNSTHTYRQELDERGHPTADRLANRKQQIDHRQRGREDFDPTRAAPGARELDRKLDRSRRRQPRQHLHDEDQLRSRRRRALDLLRPGWPSPDRALPRPACSANWFARLELRVGIQAIDEGLNQRTIVARQGVHANFNGAVHRMIHLLPTPVLTGSGSTGSQAPRISASRVSGPVTDHPKV